MRAVLMGLGKFKEKSLRHAISCNLNIDILLQFWYTLQNLVRPRSTLPRVEPFDIWLKLGPCPLSLPSFLSSLVVPAILKNSSWFFCKLKQVANILYLESPAGVGFSYSDDKNYTTNDDIVSKVVNIFPYLPFLVLHFFSPLYPF